MCISALFFFKQDREDIWFCCSDYDKKLKRIPGDDD